MVLAYVVLRKIPVSEIAKLETQQDSGRRRGPNGDLFVKVYLIRMADSPCRPLVLGSLNAQRLHLLHRGLHSDKH